MTNAEIEKMVNILAETALESYKLAKENLQSYVRTNEDVYRGMATAYLDAAEKAMVNYSVIKRMAQIKKREQRIIVNAIQELEV